MDASFAPQYIFLLKSICIMSQIPLHGSIFSMFLTEKIKSRAVRKPLPSHQEHCLAPRNRYAASLRPETVTIPQRVYHSAFCLLQSIKHFPCVNVDVFGCWRWLSVGSESSSIAFVGDELTRWWVDSAVSCWAKRRPGILVGYVWAEDVGVWVSAYEGVPVFCGISIMVTDGLLLIRPPWPVHLQLHM